MTYEEKRIECIRLINNGSVACAITGDPNTQALALDHIFNDSLDMARQFGFYIQTLANPHSKTITEKPYGGSSFIKKLYPLLQNQILLEIFRKRLQSITHNVNKKRDTFRIQLNAVITNAQFRVREYLRRQRIKNKVFTHLTNGGLIQCTKCGIVDPIVIQTDHIYNTGYVDRKYTPGTGEVSPHAYISINTGSNAYRLMSNRIDNGEDLTKEFQLLCADCNYIKTQTGDTAVLANSQPNVYYDTQQTTEKILDQYLETGLYSEEVIAQFYDEYILGNIKE